MKAAWSAAFVALGVVGLVLLAAARAAPAPGAGPRPADTWEYAELHYQSALDPARKGKGKKPGGGAVPPPVVAPAVVAPAQAAVTWITADAEVEAAGWEDMGKKLKAPPAKKGATEATQKLRVLNRLGAAGWEVYAHRATDSRPQAEVWLLKRKLR